MSKLEVYDPPMCCKSGICGEHPDFVLVNFASDLEWLKAQGVEVVRHGLSLEPTEFTKNQEVSRLMEEEGSKCLPIIIFDDKVVFKGDYISRVNLAEYCNLPFDDDDAPPVHREENCCCGLDCDCSLPHKQEDDTHLSE